MTDSLFDDVSVVTVERFAVLGGERVPLSECDWLRIAPCGCAAGVSVADLHGHVIASEQEAMIEFSETETAKGAERDRAAGWSVRLITHADFCADKSLLNCDHEPKWGVRKAERDGHTWAVKSGSRRQSYRHLVPDTSLVPPINADKPSPFPDMDQRAAALCGAGRNSFWRSDWHYTSGTMRCSRCEEIAFSISVPVLDCP